MEVTGQPLPTGRVCTLCNTKPASFLLSNCTDGEQSLGAVPGMLQLELHVCKTQCVRLCMRVHTDYMEITSFPQPHLLVRFHLRRGCHCFPKSYKANKTKVGVRPPSLTLVQNCQLENFCPEVCVNLWLFKLIWAYCCCPCFSENAINCLKKKKKDTSQEKYKHSECCSAEICCGLFPQGRQRKLGFHPSDLFQEKNVPNPYNYILVSVFNRVPKKERWRLPSPSFWAQVSIQNRKKNWY